MTPIAERDPRDHLVQGLHFRQRWGKGELKGAQGLMLGQWLSWVGKDVLGVSNLFPQLFAAVCCASSNSWDWPSSEKGYTFCTHHGLGGGRCPRKEMVLLIKGDNFFSPELLWGFWGWLHSSEGLNQDPSSSGVCGTLNGLLASLSISFYFCKVGMMTTVTVTWVCSGDKGQKDLSLAELNDPFQSKLPFGLLLESLGLFFSAPQKCWGFPATGPLSILFPLPTMLFATTFSLVLISLLPVHPSDLNSGITSSEKS